MKIKTAFVYPPIPIRHFDWSAIDEETYDGPGCPVGYGATEQEAIDDLLAQVDDEPLSDPASAIDDIRADLAALLR